MRFCECGQPVFSTDKKTRIGYCKSHQWKRTDTDKRSIIQKAISKESSKKEMYKVRGLINEPENKEMKIANDDLLIFFEGRMRSCFPKCDNCGEVRLHLLEEKFKKQWKSCQAHLLPKRHFKSIRTHELNAMVLGSGYSGLCNCHDNYDHDWDRASKMNIWPEVVRRFKILYPFIAENEHQYIPELLLETLK